MVAEFDVEVGGRILHGYDTGRDGDLVVVWHHGTPNIGTPPRPLFVRAEHLGIRWVSYDRPGYGGSTPRPNRAVAPPPRTWPPSPITWISISTR